MAPFLFDSDRKSCRKFDGTRFPAMASSLMMLPTTQMICDLCMKIPAWAWGILVCFESIRCFTKARRLDAVVTELDSTQSKSISEAVSLLHQCGKSYY